jgi:hypothetical protein
VSRYHKRPYPEPIDQDKEAWYVFLVLTFPFGWTLRWLWRWLQAAP